MKIGPRTPEEEEFNERFEAAVAAFRKKLGKFDKGTELLIVSRRGDGICINSTAECCHAAARIADVALEKLTIICDENDRRNSELN